jgi:hypothetical protein
MTLRLIDGFDYLDTGQQTGPLAGQQWTGNVNDARIVSPGRFNYGKCLFLLDSGTRRINRLMPVNMSVAGSMSYVGLAVLNPNYDTGDEYQWFSFGEGVSGVDHFTLTMGEFGVLRLRRGNESGTLLASSSALGTIAFDRWFYLELGFSIGATASIEVRLNGVTIFDLVDVNNQGAGGNPWWNLFRMCQFNNGWYMDDFYVCDDQGTVNNNFLGNARVRTLLPNGPGDLTEWDRSNTGLANWQNVRNTGIDDTLYAYTPTVGEQDLYTIDPQVYAPTVFGVQLGGFYRQDDATQRYIKNAMKTGGTIYRGAQQATYQSYTYQRDMFELNPYTGLPFTPAEVNGLQIGPYVDA